MQIFDGHKFEKLTVENEFRFWFKKFKLLFSVSKIFAYYFLKLHLHNFSKIKSSVVEPEP